MEQACTGCGYRSANRSFFRREKAGIFGRKRAFCHGCAPYQPTRWERASVHSLWMFMAGALLVAGGVRGLLQGIGYLWVVFGAMGLFWGATTIVHELGHVAAARAAGMTVVRVTVGSGPLLVARQWRDIRFELRRFTLMGGLTAVYDPIEPPEKWRHVVMLLGGAGANLLLLLLGAGALALLISRYALSNPFVVAVAFGALLSQVFAIVANLLPRRPRPDRPGRTTDGRHIVDLFRAKDFPRKAQEGGLFWRGMALLQSDRNAEAQAHFEEAHRLFPDSVMLFSLLVYSATMAAGPQAALRYYFQRSREFDGKREADNAWAYMSVAWCALLTQDPAMLPLADDLTQRAIASLPTAPKIQGTRGAVLVEMGQLEPGLALLREGIRGTPELGEKVRFALSLARGERARGNADLAVEFEALGRHLSAQSGPK